MVTNALLLSLLMWIGSHTPYDIAQVPLPKVQYHTKAELQDIYYGDCTRDTHLVILAVYDEGTVHFNKTINPQKGEDTAIVVHELFHHVQRMSKTKTSGSKEAQEKETIEVENIWREEHGLGKKIFVPSKAIYTCSN